MNVINSGLEFRQELKRMSRVDILERRRILDEWEVNDTKDTQYRTEIDKMSSEVGCGSVNEFLIRLGYLPDPSIKKPKTKIDSVKRQEIVNDLKLGTMPTKEISLKYGVTVDAVYNVKSKAGLTKRREKVVLVRTEETKDKTVIVPIPPTVVPPAQDEIAA
jgi:hypothetical protein